MHRKNTGNFGSIGVGPERPDKRAPKRHASRVHAPSRPATKYPVRVQDGQQPTPMQQTADGCHHKVVYWHLHTDCPGDRTDPALPTHSHTAYGHPCSVPASHRTLPLWSVPMASKNVPTVDAFDSPARMAGKPGNSTRTSQPASCNAAGNAPAMSANPPVFSSGNISALT